MDRQEAIDILTDIKEQILELLGTAEEALRGFDGVYNRASAYWLAHLRCALDHDHGYLGGCMGTLQDSIEELESGE